jgi:hypothetical protein
MAVDLTDTLGVEAPPLTPEQLRIKDLILDSLNLISQEVADNGDTVSTTRLLANLLEITQAADTTNITVDMLSDLMDTSEKRAILLAGFAVTNIMYIKSKFGD